MIYCVTDLDGYLLRLDFDHDRKLENKISAPAPDWSPLFKPKWDGEKWIETGKAPEPTPQEPTELELLMLAISELDMQRELDRTDNQVAIAELAESLIGGI